MISVSGQFVETADIESDKKGTEKEKTAEIEQGNLFILIVGNGFECLFVILKLHIPPLLAYVNNTPFICFSRWKKR